MGQKGSKTTRTTSSFKPLISNSGQKKSLAASDTAQSNNSSYRYSRSRIIENFIVIWLNSNISESDGDPRNFIIHLRRIVNSIKIFPDPDQCIDYLTKVKDEKVFLIVSGSLEQPIVSLISEMTQLASIYIYCDDNFKHERCVQECRKVKGVFTQIELLCDALKCDVRQFESNLIPISIISSTSTTDLNEIDPSFIYSQLFKEIVLESKFDTKYKEDFVDFCRIHYVNNNQELQVIDEFERKYSRPSAIWWCTRSMSIWWYTRECFIYSMLNKALRIQDVEVIIKMGFFIRDLHREIEQLHSKVNYRHLLIMYRGQGMLHPEFEKMKNSIGGLLSFNNFLSTNTDRTVALYFAGCARENADLTAILFRMEINPSISTTPFVLLDNISYFKDAEKEILFSMHTIFRIGEIKLIEDRLWQVNLTLSNDNNEQLTHLTQQMREATQGPTGLHRMAKLMYYMGEFFKAQEIYTALLLETTTDDNRQQLALFHHQLGYVLKKNGDLTGALSQYQQSLDVYLTYLSPDDSRLSPIYTGIGQVLRKLGDLESALEHLEHALNIDLDAPQSDPVEIANRYSDIGGVLKDQGNYVEALKSYDRALEIYLVHLSPHHPFLAITYSNIGLVHNSMEDHANALSYYKKTLEIHEKSLPFDHPSLAITYHNMAYALNDLNRTQEAIEHAERAMDIARRSLGPAESQVQEN